MFDQMKVQDVSKVRGQLNTHTTRVNERLEVPIGLDSTPLGVMRNVSKKQKEGKEAS